MNIRNLLITFIVIAVLIVSMIVVGIWNKNKLRFGDYGELAEYNLRIYPVNDSLSDLKTFSPESLKGKKFMVIIMASWCGHCKEQLELLKQYKQDLHLPIIGLIVNDSQENINQILHDYPHVLDAIVIDDNSQAYHIFKANFIPKTFIIDEQGKIVMVSNNKLNQANIEQIVNHFRE